MCGTQSTSIIKPKPKPKGYSSCMDTLGFFSLFERSANAGRKIQADQTRYKLGIR